MLGLCGERVGPIVVKKGRWDVHLVKFKPPSEHERDDSQTAPFELYTAGYTVLLHKSPQEFIHLVSSTDRIQSYFP